VCTDELTVTVLELRRAATGRLPTIDSLIAAAAVKHDAVLVHRIHTSSLFPATC
jgi:predicted nucleic acid-binding protein